MKAVQLLALLLVNLIVMLQFSLLAPILPLEIKRRAISQNYTGLIMGSVCVGYLLCPQSVTEALFPRLGRRRTALLGFMLMSFSLLFYGLGVFIPDERRTLFVVFSLLTRLLEGLGISTTVTSIVSLTLKLFPEEIAFTQTVRFLGAFTGTTLGVVAGAFFFELLGYFGVFLSFSAAVFLTSFLMLAFEEDASQESREGDASLTYWSLLKVRRVSLVMVCGLATDLLLYSLDTTLALKLRESFDYSTHTIGLFFGIFLAGTIVVGVVALFFPEQWEKRKLVVAMLWMNFVAPLLIGPSKVLHLPDEPGLIGAGLALGGSTRSLMAACIIAEGVKGGVAQFPESRVRVGDLVGSMHMVGQGVTLLVCPVVGSALAKEVGFASMMDLEALLFLGVSIVFTAFAVADLKKEKEEKARLIGQNAWEEEEDESLLKLE